MNKTINILLFGESGAGKSTTINALANYLHYSSFDDAEVGQFVNLIPSRVTWFDPVTYDDLIIQDDSVDENERFNDSGNSVTQSPKNYEFQYGDKRIRIIDTPGMGDTGGLDVDKQNFKNILEHLKTVGELHGICFLIKTITTRKTAVFEYCLSELLVHLPRSASNIIMFCFTFGRNSFYGPGDGYETLKGFINGTKLGFEKINLKTGENCFFIDNEAFQYFLAKQNKNLKFTDNQRKSYKESWDKSVQQSFDMINRIVNFEPIKVDTIFALKECQKLAKDLINPIENLKTKIDEQTNDKQLKRTKRYGGGNSNDYFHEYLNQNGAMLKELELIQEYTRDLIKFLVINLNTNCHNLIEPYLSLYEEDGSEASKLSIASQNPFKRVKLSNERISADSMSKITSIIVRIRKESNQIDVDVDYFKTIKQKLVDLSFSGNQIREMLGIEKRVVPRNLSSVSIQAKLPKNDSSKYFDSPQTDLTQNFQSFNPNIKQYNKQNHSQEIPLTETINRNVSNQTENTTTHVTVNIDFNQAEPFSVRTERTKSVASIEQPIQQPEQNVIPSTDSSEYVPSANEIDYGNIIISYESEFEEEDCEKLLPTKSTCDKVELVRTETSTINSNSIVEMHNQNDEAQNHQNHKSKNNVDCEKGQLLLNRTESKATISSTNSHHKETQTSTFDENQNSDQNASYSTMIPKHDLQSLIVRSRKSRCDCCSKCMHFAAKCIRRFFIWICACF